MGLLWSAGFENNNASELSQPLTAGFTISSTFADASTYSLKVDSTAAVGAETILKDSLYALTCYLRMRFYINDISIPTVQRDAPFLVFRDQSDALIGYLLHRVNATTGIHQIYVVNFISGTNAGPYTPVGGIWYTIETKLVISPNAGIFEMVIGGDGAPPYTLSSQNLGTSAVKSVRAAGGGFAEFEVYADNYRLMNNVYPTRGEPIAPVNHIRPRAFVPGLAR